MESWSYVSERKRFRSDEINSPANSLARNKLSLSNWESQNSYCFGHSKSDIDNQGQQHIDKDLTSSSKVMPAFPGHDLISSKMSGSIVDSSSWDSSLICLNLGRFSGHKNAPPPPIWSSLDSSSKPPSKRVKSSGLNSQAYFCQVYGCNKDLCSSKDYHKRHKVCEMHSKTARVIVNGFEQRFCQQCSRFHLLAEFDDGKRSCRKRLAGHNERRRKPLVGTTSGKSLHPYDNISFPSTKVLASTSFICQEILPSPPLLLHTNKFQTNDWSGQIKVEQDSNKSSLRPPLHCNIGTHVPGYSDKVANTGQYTFNPNASADYMFNEASIGSEGLSFFDTSCVPVSGCALSLLSSHHQSQNSSTHSSKIAMPLPKLVMPDSSQSQTNYSMSLLASSESSDVINFKIKDQISHGTCPTIDLLQLSSQLERVEHQKRSSTMWWVPHSS